jgi:hypothetical protein
MLPRLTLKCDASEEIYVLSADGQDWSLSFDSMITALEHAGTLFEEQVELVVINEEGKIIIHSTVNPNPQLRVAIRRLVKSGLAPAAQWFRNGRPTEEAVHFLLIEPIHGRPSGIAEQSQFMLGEDAAVVSDFENLC